MVSSMILPAPTQGCLHLPRLPVCRDRASARLSGSEQGAISYGRRPRVPRHQHRAAVHPCRPASRTPTSTANFMEVRSDPPFSISSPHDGEDRRLVRQFTSTLMTVAERRARRWQDYGLRYLDAYAALRSRTREAHAGADPARRGSARHARRGQPLRRRPR